MWVHPSGREIAHFTILGLPVSPPPLAVEVHLAGAWHTLNVAGADAWIVVQGPDAPTDTPDVVVLPLGRHVPLVRVTDNPETILRTADPIYVGASELPGPLTLGLGGPCSWPIIYTDCSGPSVDDGLADAGPAEVGPPSVTASLPQEAAERMAVEFLWAWTGERFGLCSLSLRPVREPCRRLATFRGLPRGASTDARFGPGVWTDAGPLAVGGLSCGSCVTRECGCLESRDLILPGPVAAVDEVRIDGETLDPSAYVVYDHSRILRIDGSHWPSRQDLAADPATDPHTFEITYWRGVPVPVGGQVAAGILAREFAKALCNDSSCALPQRVQTVTRQGVTVAVLDEFKNVERGRTGLWAVDSWVASVTRPRRPAKVYSPDDFASPPRSPGRRYPRRPWTSS